MDEASEAKVRGERDGKKERKKEGGRRQYLECVVKGSGCIGQEV